MLRRLEHDAELAECWERWQLCGDVMRGLHHDLLPADFSRRVALAIAGDGQRNAASADAGSPPAGARTASGSSRRASLSRWGGAALAASVAMAALFITRQFPGVDLASPELPAQQAASTAPSKGPVVPIVQREAADPVMAVDVATSGSLAATDPLHGKGTGTLAAAIVVADVPRRASERRSRGQSQRAASRIRQQQSVENATPLMVAANGGSGLPTAPPLPQRTITQHASAVEVAAATPATSSVDPFAPQAIAVSRPWPRAVLPGYSSDAPFSTSYGSDGAGSAFHPFEPRVDLQQRPAESAVVPAGDAN